MADFPDSAKRQLGYFHGLSKVPTESTQNVYESKYKSAHNIKSTDVWTDTVNYAATSLDADNEALSNSAVTKYTQFSLTMIPGSNSQSWYLDDNGLFVRPFISPVDIPEITTNNSSDGYQALLYDNSNNLITPTEGAWVIDYYSGIIKFAEGYTPIDMSWGNPKITCYVYTGETGADSGNAEEVESKTLTITNMTNKYFDLNFTPVNREKVLIFVESGMKGELDIDFNIIGKRIDWDGYDWDGQLTINDVLSIVYWY